MIVIPFASFFFGSSEAPVSALSIAATTAAGRSQLAFPSCMWNPSFYFTKLLHMGIIHQTSGKKKPRCYGFGFCAPVRFR